MLFACRFTIGLTVILCIISVMFPTNFVLSATFKRNTKMLYSIFRFTLPKQSKSFYSVFPTTDVIFYRQKHSRLLFVCSKALLARLSFVCHGNADRQKQHGIGKRAHRKIPHARCGTNNRQSNTPPHENLTKIVGMSRVFPKSATNKRAVTVFAEFVHLNIRNSLHNCRAPSDMQRNTTLIPVIAMPSRMA